MTDLIMCSKADGGMKAGLGFKRSERRDVTTCPLGRDPTFSRASVAESNLFIQVYTQKINIKYYKG